MAARISIKGRYSIDTKHQNVLGTGAYGIVYKGEDSVSKKTIAAKSVDGKKHPQMFRDNRQALLELNHTNVVKVMDFYQQNTTFWIPMEFCQLGDLDHFFCKSHLDWSQMLEIMTGIAKGISYLHEQNIIHRDVKPGNILIASESPLVPKLTDFDLSKSLSWEQQAMSSNVGTLCFKAPEFFQRKRGKLMYDRSVDVFAAGVTFLTLIQAKTSTRKLRPKIETPQEDSELSMPIGQLLAERIKYKVPELNVVVTRNDAHDPIRRLIKQMTFPDPKERIPASEVCVFFAKVNNKNLAYKNLA